MKKSTLEGTPNLNEYDTIIVAFSGGKDSLASLLHLMDCGVSRDKIELWHHDIDGHGDRFMDWAVTPDYCRAVAKAFSIPLYFSWREGGFLREMLRDNTPTAQVLFETPSGVAQNKPRPKAGTRLKFPQMSADLTTRWCSAYLKIDVAASAIANQERFKGKKILVVTGERAEESTGRAGYASFEKHRTDCQKRTVHQWRPVHQWTTSQVWSIIERYKVTPHPCYQMGWGRCSCACCIFGNADQWASIARVNPEQIAEVAAMEDIFGTTIRRERISILDYAKKGTAYATVSQELASQANSTTFNQPVFMDAWVSPAGATADLTGPC